MLYLFGVFIFSHLVDFWSYQLVVIMLIKSIQKSKTTEQLYCNCYVTTLQLRPLYYKDESSYFVTKKYEFGLTDIGKE